jgi:Cu(I)/Ag(I) efflux system membrane protein CusA/SilA
MLDKIVQYFLYNRFMALLMLAVTIGWGIAVAPFDWQGGWWPSDPVAVDAIPDIGENQQIVATEWQGRSPRDVQEQVTYPLTTSLLGIAGVKTVRSTSMFGMSFIYVIFDDDVEFYWSRSRILEKLNSLPAGTLPVGVQPTLGPDATSLGQVFWYTLEGREPDTGQPTGGWSPEELRSVQDFYIRYGLMATEGVSEVASVGGFVKEYQVEADPDAMRARNVTLPELMKAIQQSNLDVGAETIELNRVEYLVRGLGYIQSITDLEEAAVAVRNGVPVRVSDVARVTLGPATRRGGLDKEGIEAVGGVVVARYGANPMAVIKAVKAKVEELSVGLPQKTLPDGTVSQVTLIPFYDRSGLIRETIGTLETALLHEILICILVVIVLILNLRASLVISALLPVAVLAAFIMMRYTGVEANIVALSGIAIAIGVMVDVGVVIVESIVRRLQEQGEDFVRQGKAFADLIRESVCEVSSALTTGMCTTVISFLPVFAMQAQEGKLFIPLAWTKSFALVAAFVLGFTLLPTLAYYLLRWHVPHLPKHCRLLCTATAIVTVICLLTADWLPMGTEAGYLLNLLFVIVAVGVILASLYTLVIFYEPVLRWCLANRYKFLFLPLVILAFGVWIWRGMGKEFMPNLDEGSFLLMPTSMPHTGITQNRELIATIDQRLTTIPEIESAVGKWGRVNSALDPAPTQMFEHTINYRSEYTLDANGRRRRFKTDGDGAFILRTGGVYDPDEGFRLIPADSLVDDFRGNYFRQWRPHIRSTDDIWQEILHATDLPGLTSAPRLQPIEARLVMLSTGLRAPMGLKISAPTLDEIEIAGNAIESTLKEVPSILPASVFYDRSLAAPYIELHLDRHAMARYGVTVSGLQEIIQSVIGGMPLTITVEGRERYPVRLRYPRELRDSPEALADILIPTANDVPIPLGELAGITYAKGPQMIQSENTFLTGYILFDKQPGIAEVDVVNQVAAYLRTKITDGSLVLPPGTVYTFVGNYEQQQRAAYRLLFIIPLCLFAILLLLYIRFRTLTATAIHFSGVFVALAGGFIILWFYGQPWFMDIEFGGINLRELFQIHPVNLSIAVWVGFIALFGIATDDGVLMGTFIHETFQRLQPRSIEEIRQAVVQAGLRRVRPAAMTTATTLIALLPVLTSTGKGADIMIPMAIPTFGGMFIQSITMFIVPVLQSWWRESRIDTGISEKRRWKITRYLPKRFHRKVICFCIVSGWCILPSSAIWNPSVEEEIAQAIHRHPSVQAANLSYKAALERIPQAEAWQNPTLEIGLYPQLFTFPEIRLMQMLPQFSVRQAARTEAKYMANVNESRFYETMTSVTLTLRTQWELLLKLRQEEVIRQTDRLLLTSLQALASKGLSSGNNLPAVLRLQLETDEADTYLTDLADRIQTEIRRFNHFLDRAPETPVDLPDTILLHPLPMDEDEALRQLRFHNPTLAMQTHEASALEARRVMERRKSYPMIGLGLQYTFMAPATMSASTAKMNPKGMVMPMFSLTLPVHRGKYRAAERENNLLKNEAIHQRQTIEHELAAELILLYANYRRSLRQAEQFRQQQQTLETTFNLLLHNLSTGTATLDDLLNLRRLLLNNRLQFTDTVAEANLSIAQIRKLTDNPQLQVVH